MDKLTYLYDKIDDELDDAEDYIEHAIQYKEACPEIARALAQLSAEEMQHMQVLQGLTAQELAAKRKDSAGMLPDDLHAVHEWLQCRHAKRAKEVKRMQDLYAGR